MKRGKMRHMITINDVTPGQDAFGNTGTATALCSVWANVESLNQGRALYYGIVENKASYKIVTGYLENKELKPGSTITWNSKTLNVHSVIDQDARNNKLTIIAYE